MVVSPTSSATWWPLAAPSASAGWMTRLAPVCAGVAVTVVVETLLGTRAPYDRVPGSKGGFKFPSDSDSSLSVASAVAITFVTVIV